MTVKDLDARLRLLESEEKITITAGEVRALLNYGMAKVATELGQEAEKQLVEYKRVGLSGASIPDFLATSSTLDYIKRHTHYGTVDEYGAWQVDMEIVD